MAKRHTAAAKEPSKKLLLDVITWCYNFRCGMEPQRKKALLKLLGGDVARRKVVKNDSTEEHYPRQD